MITKGTVHCRDQNTQETALAVGKYWEKKLLEIHYSDTQGYCIQSLRIGFYLFFKEAKRSFGQEKCLLGVKTTTGSNFKREKIRGLRDGSAVKGD